VIAVSIYRLFDNTMVHLAPKRMELWTQRWTDKAGKGEFIRRNKTIPSRAFFARGGIA
jgi:hypothetical protein